MIRLTIALFLSLQLIACGGGGGGGDDSGAGGNSPAADSPAAPNKKFEDIVVPEGFKFRSAYPVTVDIDLNSSEDMYLNIYGRFTEAQDGTPIPDSSSRMITSTMKDGKFKGKLTVTPKRESLLVEAWYQDGARQPFRQVIPLPVSEIVINQ
ncbi:hypothetical protein A3K86_03890 [Photobacterium jeanii]|uniref:Bacterial spore germination immunoglobulin-like domain-containing protein n=1 Tax=Photobacterium jeanii TaxID=858640 RepID=A0A178KLC5_9GAMM|nr:hypothetical protein [Photobacterium jeanii]OAN18067.1 hypothetical protein A3K86_03890 [Photobacterium jeanii]PST92260.1 hypothetical protein C9I91_03550 [Photobacterium jeanii]